MSLSRTGALLFTGFVLGASLFTAASLVLAWTGPTSAPPNGNVSPPINVGTTDQVKNAGLGINSLAVFGNSILQAASYLNWGSTSGSSGYGIRDNAGVLEFKNSGSLWNNLSNSVLNVLGTGSVTQIKFSDGTTQTTAPAGGGITNVTTASCTASCFSPGCTGSCVSTCPATYFRTGCGSTLSGASPSGSTGCTCSAGFGSGNANTCYAFCAK